DALFGPSPAEARARAEATKMARQESQSSALALARAAAEALMDAEALNKQLGTQIDMFGKSADAIKVYELRMRAGLNASEEFKRTIAETVRLQEQLADLQMKSKLTAETRTPFESFQQRLAEVRPFFDRNPNDVLFGRVLGQAFDQLRSSIKM